MKLRERVAIVTGSSMGIGEAIAGAFLREGARVVVNSREQKRAADAAGRLAQGGGETLAVAADVATRAGVDRLIGAAVDRWGRLDIMVNNAGTSMIAPSADLSDESWRSVIDLNLTGAFMGAQAAAA